LGAITLTRPNSGPFTKRETSGSRSLISFPPDVFTRSFSPRPLCLSAAFYDGRNGSHIPARSRLCPPHECAPFPCSNIVPTNVEFYGRLFPSLVRSLHGNGRSVFPSFPFMSRRASHRSFSFSMTSAPRTRIAYECRCSYLPGLEFLVLSPPRISSCPAWFFP